MLTNQTPADESVAHLCQKVNLSTMTKLLLRVTAQKRIQSGWIFKPFMSNEYVVKEAH